MQSLKTKLQIKHFLNLQGLAYWMDQYQESDVAEPAMKQGVQHSTYFTLRLTQNVFSKEVVKKCKRMLNRTLENILDYVINQYLHFISMN